MTDEFDIDVIDDGYPSHLEIGGQGDGQSFGVEVGGEGQSFGEEIGATPEEAEAVQLGIYRTLAKARDNRRAATPMRAVPVDAPRQRYPEEASLVGICGGSGEELFPLTVSLLKKYGGSAGEPRIVRVDSLASYKRFRLHDSPEMSAFKDRVADVERKLSAHMADPDAHSSVPRALEAELQDLHQAGEEIAQIEQAKQVPLRMPKHFDGMIEAWHEDGVVGASLVIPGADGAPRICTSMEPIEKGVLEAAKAATEARVPAAQIVGFLPAIGAALSAATAIKETASGVESILKRPEAKHARPFLIRLEPQKSPAIFALAELACLCAVEGNLQACDEWQRLATGAPPVVKQAMGEVCQALKAQKATTLGESKADSWLAHAWAKIRGSSASETTPMLARRTRHRCMRSRPSPSRRLMSRPRSCGSSPSRRSRPASSGGTEGRMHSEKARDSGSRPRRPGAHAGRVDDEKIRAFVQTAIGAARQQPSRQSEILGEAAMRLAGMAHHKDHATAAPLLIALAEQFASAAMASETPATTDDFHELLIEQKEAREDGFSDDLNIRARSEAIHDAHQAEVTPRVSIAPASWGKGATLGRSGTFKYAPSSQDVADGIQQSATLAFWQGQPHESQALSIDLSLVAAPMPIGVLPAPSPGIDVSARPYGVVTYGSDGAIVSVRFDAGFGTRFNVSGSYVSIVAGMQAPLAGVAPGILSFSASIGAFASPSLAPVTLTEYIDALASGATTVPIQRPQHASQLLPLLSSSTGGTALLTFYGQGAGGALLTFSYPIGQLLQPIPLPSEVQYVTLRNLTGQAANFRLMFQLSL